MSALLLLPILAAAPPFELKDGDRVVWIGSAIAEREQKYGYWETALLCQWPDRKITVRNLGRSGDTVDGIAWAGFDPPAKGYERLVKAVKDEKPTVIFVSYGSVEALDDGYSTTKLAKSLQRLLDDLTLLKARIVLFTPTPPETSDDYPKVQMRGGAVTIREFQDKGYQIADLHDCLSRHGKSESGLRFTDNGLHLSEAGYEGTIPDFLTSFGLSWAGEEPKRFEAIRKLVVKKNELVFHMLRPQNDVYLYSFRKHEQGNNAREVKDFQPLIDEVEKEILKKLR